MSAPAPRRKWRKDFQPFPFDVLHTHLEFDLDPEATRVRSRIEVRRRPGAGDDAPLALDGEGLETIHFRRDGVDLDVAQLGRDEEGRLLVPDIGAQAVIEAEVRIAPASNRALEGLYLSSGIFCTQCEAEGFRRITWYPDRPDVMTTFDVIVNGDPEQTPVLLSNGNRVREETLADGRRSVHWQDPFKKPSYLFALVAGDLKCHAGTFRTMSGRDVAMEIWVEPENIDKCEHALQSLARSMKWDEERFGLEYDLDLYMIVAVSDFNMGAMENKGLNVFNSKYVLALPETATDDDYEHIEGVIAHEYFHNWTGNRVTCKDWFQLTLKEGLTVYRDQRFTADMTSRAVKRIDDVRGLRAAQFVEDAGPMAHPIRPESYIEMNNFYTSTVYEKGAEVVRMYATFLGEDGFRKGMDLYFERHDGQAVTCDDFRAAMADANGWDATSFERWYEQPGTPEVAVTESWDPASGTLSVALTQSNPRAEGADPLVIPVRTALLDDAGAELPVTLEGESEAGPTERVLAFEEREATFRFTGLKARPTASLFRDFSAPVKVTADRDAADLAFRMGKETDPFNRWDAGQELAYQVLLDAASCVADGREVELAPAFVAAFRSVLLDESLDGSLKAQALVLPSERMLAQRVAVVHMDHLHAARRLVRSQLALALEDDWRTIFAATLPEGPYSPDPAAIQRRRLNGTCLAWLARLPGGAVLVAERYHEADNMTDRQSALGLLADLGGAEATTALADFAERHGDDRLVMDKWFSVQAMATHEDALERILALRDDPRFTLDNPNRVRSLAGVFAFGNLPVFHSADGRGYAFLEAIVTELDASNPQVASRMVSAFNDHRRHEPGRQALMRATIERIAAREGLSKDVFEITSKALEG